MTRPLALTLGEPAGNVRISPSQPGLSAPTLRCRRFISGRPRFPRAARGAARPAHSGARCRARRRTRGLFGGAAGCRARREGHGGAGRSGRMGGSGGDRIDPSCGRGRFRGSRPCGCDKSCRKGGPLSHRLRRTRTYRISRETRAGAHRARGASGDDAMVARARRRAGDHPLPVRDVPQQLTTDADCRHGRIVARDLNERFGIARPRLALCRLNPHAGEDGALGGGGCRRRRSRGHATARGWHRCARPPFRPTPCSMPLRGALTMRRSRCITIRR